MSKRKKIIQHNKKKSIENPSNRLQNHIKLPHEQTKSALIVPNFQILHYYRLSIQNQQPKQEMHTILTSHIEIKIQGD